MKKNYFTNFLAYTGIPYQALKYGGLRGKHPVFVMYLKPKLIFSFFITMHTTKPDAIVLVTIAFMHEKCGGGKGQTKKADFFDILPKPVCQFI